MPAGRQPGVGEDDVDVAVAVAAHRDGGTGRAGGDGRVGDLDGQEPRQAGAQHRAARSPRGRLPRCADGREHAVVRYWHVSGPGASGRPSTARAPSSTRCGEPCPTNGIRSGAVERRNRRSTATCRSRTTSSTHVATRISAARTSAALALPPTRAPRCPIPSLRRAPAVSTTRMRCSLSIAPACRQSCSSASPIRAPADQGAGRTHLVRRPVRPQAAPRRRAAAGRRASRAGTRPRRPGRVRPSGPCGRAREARPRRTGWSAGSAAAGGPSGRSSSASVNPVPTWPR